MVIDARDAAQFEADHIPGAVNIEWRRAVARRDEIPRDKPVVVYCNTGSLSAQVAFALRLPGWDNVLDEPIEPKHVEPLLRRKATRQEEIELLQRDLDPLKEKREETPQHIMVEESHHGRGASRRGAL